MFLDIPLENLCVVAEETLATTVHVVQDGAKQVALVVDRDMKLLGIVTDGDLRRAMLSGVSMSCAIEEVMQTSYTAGTPQMTARDLFNLMQKKLIRHLPIIDNAGCVVDLVWLSDLIKQDTLDLSAVVMAGGFGKRLRPLTENLPKPMLPVGDRPVMAHIIDNLRCAGVRDVNVTTHYMPEKIKDYFGNGDGFGVSIDYVSEDRPLGTAGALGLMDVPAQPRLVVNGDILTEIDYRAMLAYHREHQADLTVGVRQYEFQVPYGVVNCDGADIQELCEKPMQKFLVNAGIYIIEPGAHAYIPQNERFDMTELIDALLADQRRVVSFPIMEYWLDIGQHADYQRAQTYGEKRRLSA